VFSDNCPSKYISSKSGFKISLKPKLKQCFGVTSVLNRFLVAKQGLQFGFEKHQKSNNLVSPMVNHIAQNANVAEDCRVFTL